jgi:hypothetical protein
MDDVHRLRAEHRFTHVVPAPTHIGEYHPDVVEIYYPAPRHPSTSVGVVAPHHEPTTSYPSTYLYWREIPTRQAYLEAQEAAYQDRERDRVRETMAATRGARRRLKKLERLASQDRLPPHLIRELEELRESLS